MEQHGIDLLFLPPSANLHYLSGIPREEQNFGNTMYPGDWMTGAWICPAHPPVFTVPRMMADFHSSFSAAEVRVLPDSGDALGLVRDLLKGLGVSGAIKVAIEDRARAEAMMNIQSLLPKAQFVSASSLMVPLRMIKDEAELATLRRAGEITEAAYAATLGTLRPGMTTLDLVTEVNYQLKRHGSFAPSFNTSFYNFGPRHPFNFHNHEAVLNLPLEPPVCILFDFGAVWDGYCYDYGRTVFFGEPQPEWVRAYGLVMASQKAGIEALKAGNTCEQADAVARAVLADAGYGPAFRHRLGHGIGMDVHEPPFLNAGNTTVLQRGMCFTVEPSITLPGQYGARVEDIVVVGADGGLPLTDGFEELRVI
jgi:Xaa-Pro aminopeptidase